MYRAPSRFMLDKLSRVLRLALIAQKLGPAGGDLFDRAASGFVIPSSVTHR